MDPIASPIPLDELLGHRGWVRALARGLACDAAGADDLEQETWLAALGRPPADRSTVRAWLATVVRNAARDRSRSGGRRAARELAAARTESVEAAADVVARGESHKRVVLAVMDLDEPYRTTILLRYFEELPPREVAARMGCPVETVRTRTKRALALLRERLGGDDRDAWRGAILPLLAAPPAEAATTTTRGPTMLPLKIAAVAALLLVTAPAAWLLLAPGGAHPAAPPDAPPDAAAATGGDAPPVRRRVGVAPPADLAPGDDDETGGGHVEVWPPEVPLPPEEEAAVYANGRLTVRVSVEPAHPRAGAPFDLCVTFGNDGTGPLRFHVPEHTGLVPFPRLEIRGADGRVLLPVAASFQSMWQDGLQGEIVRLEPGEERTVTTQVGGVAEAPDDPTGTDTSRFTPSQKHLPLPPGDYAVTAVFAKAKPVVPWGEPDFRRSEKEVPGLWTGAVRSTPIAFRLAPPDEPMLTLEGPEKLVPGAGTTLTLTVANPSQEDREIRGAFALRRAQKGDPGHVAWFAFGERGVPATPDHSRVLSLPAGASRTCTLDVGALVWSRAADRGAPFHRGTWPWDREHPAIWVTCGERDEGGGGMLGSNTLFRALEPAPDLSELGVALRVEADGLSAEEPFVVVRLRNDGPRGVAVPRDLGSPRRLRLSAVQPDANRGPRELTMAASPSAGALAPEDLTVLLPGDEIRARVPLVAGWAAELPAGSYELRAHWANADAGDRAGFERSPLVGRLMSLPVDIVVPAR